MTQGTQIVANLEDDRIYALYDEIVEQRRSPETSPELFLKFCFRLNAILERYHDWLAETVAAGEPMPTNEKSHEKLREIMQETELIDIMSEKNLDTVELYYKRKYLLPKFEDEVQLAVRNEKNWLRDFLVSFCASFTVPVFLYIIVFILLLMFGDAKLSELMMPTKWLNGV